MKKSRRGSKVSVCNSCVSDNVLSFEIKNSGKAEECDFCTEEGPCWSIATLAQRVGPVFHEHYSLTADAPEGYEYYLNKDSDSDYEWERDGQGVEEILQEILGVDEEIAAAIVVELDRNSGYDPRDGDGEDPYGFEAMYGPTYSSESPMDFPWESMKEDLRHRSRFFSSRTTEILSNVFHDVQQLKGTKGPVIAIVDETVPIYRGRIAWSINDLKKFLSSPNLELASPPKRLAQAGRMNAAGISVFYGALDSDTCLAEIRAPVGAKVVIAEFRPLKPLRILDLIALEGVYKEFSLFDPRYADETNRLQFLRRLSKILSEPVLPGDQELDYLPTQVVSEFIESLKPAVDGVIFRSTQSGGKSKNIVLFGRSSLVEGNSWKNQHEKSVERLLEGYDDLEEFEWQVSLKPQPKSAGDKSGSRFDTNFVFDNDPFETRLSESSSVATALRLMSSGICVHTVTAVDYSKDTEKVRVALEESEKVDPENPF